MPRGGSPKMEVIMVRFVYDLTTLVAITLFGATMLVWLNALSQFA